MNPTITKKNPTNNTTQAVVTSEHEFILAKKFNEFSDVICPFIKLENEYYTNFVIPITQLHRIQTLYEMIITGIAKFTVSENSIIFDCTKNLPNSMFGNVEEGYIHYLATVEKNKETNQNNIIVEPKLVFETLETSESVNITFNQKTKFRSEYLKAFPIILKSGFIFSTVDQQNCRLFMSILKPSENFVGECSKYEVNNLIQYILPLWSIFNINISENIQVSLRNGFLPDQFKKHESAIMIKAIYNLSNPENITISCVGNQVNVDTY